MVFNSNLFIFLFLPVCLLVYYRLLHKGKSTGAKYWLIAASLVFYGCYSPSMLLWLGGSLLYNLLLLNRLPQWGKKALVLGVLGNLFFLFYCRNLDAIPVLGVSFFSFQQISFLVDAYRREVPQYPIGDYLLFVLYFPKLLQGPIACHQELLPQFQNLEKIRFHPEPFYRGLVLFVLGLAKKVLLAETLGGAVTYGYANLSSLYTADALLVMLSYSLQLYFDFSGYCDMAMGISRMLGIALPVNFHSPYKAWNLIRFWKGWHMTLTRFLTAYVYIPLGGNRKGAMRTYVNLLLVFLVSGLWHGTGVTFLIWGMLHGILYVLTRILQKGWEGRGRERKKSGVFKRILGRAGTFLYVSIAWVFFRAPSVEEAVILLEKIVEFRWQRMAHSLAACFNIEEFWYVIKVLGIDRWQYGHDLLTFLLLPGALVLVFFGKNALEIAESSKPRVAGTLGLSCLFVWCVLSLSGVSTFLYLNF